MRHTDQIVASVTGINPAGKYLTFPALAHKHPRSRAAMIGRLPGVARVRSTATVSNTSAYRSPLIAAIDTNARRWTPPA